MLETLVQAVTGHEIHQVRGNRSGAVTHLAEDLGQGQRARRQRKFEIRVGVRLESDHFCPVLRGVKPGKERCVR